MRTIYFAFIFFIATFFNHLEASICNHKQSSIQAIIFDLGGVVIEVDKNEAADLITRTFQIDRDEALELLGKYKTHWLNGGSVQCFWEAFASEKEVQLPPCFLDLWESTLIRALKPIPGMLSIIQQLKEQGYRVALLSNARKWQTEPIQKMGYYALFNPALISWQIGFEKPDPKAYMVALNRLALPPEACIFIDDKKENVDAARALHIDGIHFSNTEQLIKELACRNIKTQLAL